jgi:hypothetical protein
MLGHPVLHLTFLCCYGMANLQHDYYIHKKYNMLKILLRSYSRTYCDFIDNDSIRSFAIMSQHGLNAPSFRSQENTQAEGKDRISRM